MDGGSPEEEAVPAEDTIDALLEFLVSPVLPLRLTSNESSLMYMPMEVADQMHAVVLLYNYYHRKQFHKLEFVDFVTFCRIACISKPPLLLHMPCIKRSVDESDDCNKEVSVTEKKVLNACNICKALELNDSPNIEGWPISRIAIFLCDSEKKNCLLQFSVITQGVWSLIESDLEIPIDSNCGEKQGKACGSRIKKADEVSGDGTFFKNDVLNCQAFSIVQQKADISRENVSILECHLTYSLSEEKAAACLYIMQYTNLGENSNSFGVEMPIDEVLGSLKGPIVKGGLNAEVTKVVEYYHLLPYDKVLSSWLSRETPTLGSTVENQEVDTTYTSVKAPQAVLSDNEIIKKPFKTEQTADIAIHKLNKLTVDITNNEGGDASNGVCKSKTEAINLSIINFKGQSNCKSVSIGKETTKRDTIFDKGESCRNNSPHARSSPGNSSLVVCSQNVKVEPCVDNVISSAHLDKNNKHPFKFPTNSVIGHKPKEDDADQVKRKSVVKVIGRNPLIESNNANEFGTEHQNRIDKNELAIVSLQSNASECGMQQLVMSSKRNDLLQVSLQDLLKKRDDLCNQHRILEDEIARCEMHVQTIFSEEDDAMLGVNFDNNVCLNKSWGETSVSPVPATQNKRKRLSEAVLILNRPCQELDDICRMNGWILPKYSLFPRNGNYQANLIVQGMDFDLQCVGDLKGNPMEAREAAATHMLIKLRSSTAKAL